MLYGASSALWILFKHAPKYCAEVALKTLGVVAKGVPHHMYRRAFLEVPVYVGAQARTDDLGIDRDTALLDGG